MGIDEVGAGAFVGDLKEYTRAHCLGFVRVMNTMDGYCLVGENEYSKLMEQREKLEKVMGQEHKMVSGQNSQYYCHYHCTLCLKWCNC